MKKELEDRLVKFSVMIFKLSRMTGDSYYNNYLINQLLRSSSSAALNYGEAQGAESKRDFIHKASIVLKELRESHVNLKIIAEAKIIDNIKEVNLALDESNQLVSIFYKTVKTAKANS
jgi:four helix bundle protein